MLGLATSAVVVGGLALHSTSATRAGTKDFMVELAFALLLLGVVLITFNGVRLGPGLALCDAALVASALTTLIALAFGAITLPVPRWLVGAAAGLLGVGLLAAAFSDEVLGNVVPAFRFSIALFLTPVLVGALGDTAGRRDLIVLAWIASVAINALVALTDFAGVTAIGETLYPQTASGRLNGLTGHPNHLGIVCAMALPLAMWALLYRYRGVAHRLPLLAVVAMLLAATVLSGSRAAMIGAVVAALLLIMLGAQRGRAAVGLGVLGAAATAVVSSLTASNSDSRLLVDRLAGDDASVAQSDAGRFEAFREALDAFSSNPAFGAGYEHVRSAHDIYLQLLQGGGLIALTAFLFFLVGSLRLGDELRRSPLLPLQQRELAAALMASLTAWFIIGLAQNALYDRFLYLPAGLVLGIALSRAAAARRRGSPVAS
jgi:O-antigen ligase